MSIQAGSPVSDDGRGLKRLDALVGFRHMVGSPVSDDGRGLKRHVDLDDVAHAKVRPSAMTGVD